MNGKHKIFISSVQSEFSRERKALARYIREDALLGDFFEVFLFEEQPAENRSAQSVYLDEVAMCDIYLGLFGSKYGSRDKNGISPTEREYDRATELHKTRLAFVKTSACREKKEEMFIRGKIDTEGTQSWHSVGTQSRHPVCCGTEGSIQERVLSFCDVPRSTKELLDKVGRSDRTKFKRFVLRVLMDDGVLEWTIPDKPNSRLQKYRLTAKGRTLAAALAKSAAKSKGKGRAK